MEATRPLSETVRPTARHLPEQPGSASAKLGVIWTGPVAAALAVLTVSGAGEDDLLAYLLLCLPVMYLAIAVTERKWTSWPLVITVLVGYKLVELLGVDPAPVLVVVGLILVVVGLVRGPLRRPGLHALQAPALAVFGGAALIALYSSAETALYTVAVGLLAHAAWDALHWWRGEVVSSSVTQWCMVFDTGVGLGVLVLL